MLVHARLSFADIEFATTRGKFWRSILAIDSRAQDATPRHTLWTNVCLWYTVCMPTSGPSAVLLIRRDEGVIRRHWICPHRWYDDGRRRYRDGEKALWFAVLDNAIEALQGTLRIERKHKPGSRFLWREARRWVKTLARTPEPIGTFVSICRELELDSATVRADLLAIPFTGRTTSPLRLVSSRPPVDLVA